MREGLWEQGVKDRPATFLLWRCRCSVHFCLHAVASHGRVFSALSVLVHLTVCTVHGQGQVPLQISEISTKRDGRRDAPGIARARGEVSQPSQDLFLTWHKAATRQRVVLASPVTAGIINSSSSSSSCFCQHTNKATHTHTQARTKPRPRYRDDWERLKQSEQHGCFIAGLSQGLLL